MPHALRPRAADFVLPGRSQAGEVITESYFLNLACGYRPVLVVLAARCRLCSTLRNDGRSNVNKTERKQTWPPPAEKQRNDTGICWIEDWMVECPIPSEQDHSHP